MSMVNLKYSARVISSDTGWGVFTTAGTTGIHYCWLCLWCPVLLSTAGTGIQYCYPLLVSTAAGLCGGDVDCLRSSLVSPVYGGTGTENCVTRDIWSLANYWLITVTTNMCDQV